MGSLHLSKHATAQPARDANPNVALILSTASDLEGDARVIGAGVLVSREGYILTAEHVLSDAAKSSHVDIELGDGTAADARVAHFNREYDLALLKIIGPVDLPEPVRLGIADEIREHLRQRGAPIPVSGIGHPTPGGHIERFSPFDARIIRSDGMFFVIDKQLYGGHSGGPLRNEDGDVIGILSKTGGTQVGEGKAIPIDYAHELFTAAGLDPYGESVQAYRSQIAELREHVTRYEKSMNWLLTYLEWYIEVCRDEGGDPGLKIEYSKRFDEQATPSPDVEVKIVPVFRTAEESEIEQINELEVRDYPEINGYNMALVKKLDRRLAEVVTRYNRLFSDSAKKYGIMLENISTLRVQLLVDAVEPEIEFQTPQRLVAYPSIEDLDTAPTCP